VAPQIGQMATPAASSTSRKLAQPFVRQNGLDGTGWAAMARRRNRRMELARPAYTAVAVRDIMFIVSSFWRASGGMGLGATPSFASRAGIGRIDR
jgi:hypothetical protein